MYAAGLGVPQDYVSAHMWSSPDSIDWLIGIENNGALIISPVAHRPSLLRMGIDTAKAINVGAFTSGQKQFLEFHRNAVLLLSIHR
jgi:hypothetical protein